MQSRYKVRLVRDNLQRTTILIFICFTDFYPGVRYLLIIRKYFSSRQWWEFDHPGTDLWSWSYCSSHHHHLWYLHVYKLSESIIRRRRRGPYHHSQTDTARLRSDRWNSSWERSRGEVIFLVAKLPILIWSLRSTPLLLTIPAQSQSWQLYGVMLSSLTGLSCPAEMRFNLVFDIRVPTGHTTSNLTDRVTPMGQLKF